MLGNDNQNNNNKLLILKIATKDAEKKNIDPVFNISEKSAETGKWGVTGSVSSVSGDLTKIEIRDQEYLGEHYNTVSLFLNDQDTQETYLLDLRLNLLTRSLVNSLLGMKDFNDIKVSLYTNKKNGYPAVSVRSHGELAHWLYNLDEVPAVDEIKDKKGNVVKRDYSDLDSFYVEKLRELAARLNSSEAPVKSAAPVDKPKSKKLEKVNKKVDSLKEEDVDRADVAEDDLF